MRISVDIDDDVLGGVKELSAREKKTVGEVLSDLARQALCPLVAEPPEMRDGFPLLPGNREIVTTELVNRLFDEEPRVLFEISDGAASVQLTCTGEC